MAQNTHGVCLLQLSSICLSTLISICGRAKDVAMVEEVWQWAAQIPGLPDLALYNTMINTQERCRQPDRAVRLFEEMQAAGLQADTTTYAALCDAFAQQGAWDKQRTALRVSCLTLLAPKHAPCHPQPLFSLTLQVRHCV